MQIVFEILPIIIFFIIYKLSGIYIATAAAIVISLLQLIGYRLIKGKIDRIQLMMLGLIVVLGSATLLLHRPIFIKWKPTVVNWLFALLFLLSRFIGKKPLIKRMLGDKVTLPEVVWQRLNNSWVLFFLLVGAANLYIAYTYSTHIWVNFKLFGVLGLTLLFAVIQAIYLAKHIDS
ncbi:MAG: septation protein A [Gammaproteobacteria bacterium]|nr:septation protein A [Gammaproteobacteria bacterium]MCP4474564.1 septation protein A [Gammaproteobacteria bacterium]